ncbi:hypothetical protein RFI_01091 [Reticulomyxa filosa]|uniref:Uncharacterized protein n=1 Tax=Reticulomyxa filosa TaxID=46433 RepID=X6PCP7_RETFI|nr:hypothetical protein RFI_01091 [Reticulomyxa filosa]|eukprot:ETO35971.1 hypothetical protein RFI_01091 [Reticulomyxa filosa]
MLQRLRLTFNQWFCDCAFLFPLYGCGDLAQGFCRSSAVKKVVFILNWTVQGIVAQPSLQVEEKEKEKYNNDNNKNESKSDVMY